MYHDYNMERIIADLKSPEKKNFILDTDTYNEIDDQFAISYMLRCPGCGRWADKHNMFAKYCPTCGTPLDD